MADVISRLKLDSGEFDSKIKRAGQELMAYSEHCRNMGLEMGYANKDAKEFAKALGDMKTVSQTARGKLNELTEAFVNLKTMYNGMTDAEKQNTFGKELAASLEKLKGRINDAKKELSDIDKELGKTRQAEDSNKSGIEALTSALGINVKSLIGWGTALAAGKAALDVAKDAFFASEATVDEWGRVVDSSKSLYEGFLTALNTGDISGYLSRIDEIVSAARTAYNELDRLGTMKTIQAPKVSAQQTENERIRSMIQTGRYIAPIDGRRNAVFNGREMQNGDKLTAGQIRALEKQLQNGMQNVVKLVGNEVKQTGKAIDAVYERQAKELGISLKEFRKGTSSMEEFDKRMAGYDKYQQWREQHTTIDQQSGREIVARGNPYAEYGKWGTFRVDGDRYNQLVQLIQQRDQQAAQAYGMQSQAYRTMNRAEGFTVSKLMGNGGKGGKGGKTDKNLDDEQKVQAKINDLLKEALTADAHRQGEIRQQVAELQKQQEKYNDIKNLAQGILPKDKEAVFTIDGQLSEETKKNLRDIENVTIDDKAMTVTADTQEAMQKVQELIGQVSTTTLQMKVKAQPVEMSTGLSGFNEQTISAWTAMMKSDLQKADLGSALYSSLTHNMEDMSRLTTTVQDAIKLGLKIPQEDVQEMFEAIFDRGTLPDDLYAGMIQKFIDEFKERTGKDLQVGENGSMSTGKDKKNDDRSTNKLLKLNEETGKYEAKANELLSTMSGGIQNITNGLESLGIEIPAELKSVLGGMQSISAILTGIATTVLAIQAITTADAIIPFAGGGIVGRAASGMLVGSHMSGDNLRMPVMDGSGGFIGVNDGEVILNRAQVGNLASQLEGGGIGNLHLETIISAEDIRVVLKNNGRRTGRGEYITSRNSRS